MTTFPTTARPRPFGISEGSIIDRLPPCDLLAEASVLGSILIEPSRLATVRVFLPKADAFFKEENQIIFRTMCELDDQRKKIDYVILNAALKSKNLIEQVGGLEYFRELGSTVPSAARAEHYAAIVKEKSMLRELISASTATLRDCYESADSAADIKGRAENRIAAISEASFAKYPTPLSEIVPGVFESIGDPEKREKLYGIQTGFSELDDVTGGLLPGDMIVIAARPSVGKSAFALNIIEHVGITLQKTCGLFSLEMKKEQLALRALCSQAFVDSHKLKSRDDSLQAHTERMQMIDKLGAVASRVASPHIYIDDAPSLTLNELRTKALWLKRHHELSLLAVDYLGLMRGERRENRTEEIRVLSAGIKALARELNVPVLCLSQLNRECESEGRHPRKSDLRSSGDIEQDADVIIMLHREVCYHRGDPQWIDSNPDKAEEALVIIDKQRNGPCKTITLRFIDGATRFVNP